MNKLAAVAALALTQSVSATTIPIDLGPVNVFYPKGILLRVPFNSDIRDFSGQHIDMDITFANGAFIRMWQSRDRGFVLEPLLFITGAGRLNDPVGFAYSLGADGRRNSGIEFFGGGYLTSDGGLSDTFLASIFPLLFGQPSIPFSTYGMHLEVTLPTSMDFTATGSGMMILGGGPTFLVHDAVPESGSTLVLLTIGIFSCAFLLRNAFRVP